MCDSCTSNRRPLLGAGGWPGAGLESLSLLWIHSCNLPGLHLTPQEGCLELDASRAKQLQGLDPTGCVSSMLGDGLDWALMVLPKALGVASLQWAEFSWWLTSFCLI